MRHASALLVLALLGLPACSLYFSDEGGGGGSGGSGEGGVDGGGEPTQDGGTPPPNGTFTFTKTRAIAGELPVVGIDSDGAGGLWIGYRVQIGGYYANADVRVVHLDPAGAKLAEFRYDDEYTQVSGLAYGGGAVWLNYGSIGTGNNHIRKLDPVTGARLGSFATEVGIIDLDVHGGQLRLSNTWNQVIALDMTTGGELWRAPVTAFAEDTQRGIASTASDNLWVVSTQSNKIIRLDPQHHVIGAGVTDLLGSPVYGSGNLQLAWDGSELILAVGNQIVWLAP